MKVSLLYFGWFLVISPLTLAAAGERFKNNAVRGGGLENIFMRNIAVGRVAEAVQTIDLLYEEGPQGDFMPVVRKVEMSGISSTASPRVMFIQGFEGAVIENIRIKHSTFTGVTATEMPPDARRVMFENVTILPAASAKSRNAVSAPLKPAGM